MGTVNTNSTFAHERKQGAIRIIGGMCSLPILAATFLFATETLRGASHAIGWQGMLFGWILSLAPLLGVFYRSGFAVDGATKTMTWWWGFWQFRFSGTSVKASEVSKLEVEGAHTSLVHSNEAESRLEHELETRERFGQSTHGLNINCYERTETEFPCVVWLEVGEKRMQLGYFEDTLSGRRLAQQVADRLDLPEGKRAFADLGEPSREIKPVGGPELEEIPRL